MTLDELLRELGSLPTMMTAKEELEVIERLESVPDDLLLRDLERFFPLLWDLFDSHTGAGIFEGDASNREEFRAFAQRLRRLAVSVENPEDAARLGNAADAFATDFRI